MKKLEKILTCFFKHPVFAILVICSVSGCDKLHEDPIEVESSSSNFQDRESDEEDSDDTDIGDEVIMDADVNDGFSDSNEADSDFNALSIKSVLNAPLQQTVDPMDQGVNVIISGGIYSVDQNNNVLEALGDSFYSEAILYIRHIEQSENIVDILLMSEFDSGLDSGLEPGTGTLWVGSHAEMFNVANSPFFDSDPHLLGDVEFQNLAVHTTWPTNKREGSSGSLNAFMHINNEGSAAVFSVKRGEFNVQLTEDGSGIWGELELLGVRVVGDETFNVAYKATLSGN